MSTRRRIGGAATLVAAGALALSACGSDSNAPTSATPTGGTATGGIRCATGSVNASGSSAQKNAMDEWVKKYQSACPGATVNYQSVGSSAGRQQFIQGSTAFGGSDSALKDNEQAAADKRCQNNKAINIPMLAGPIALGYNLKGVDGLSLRPATIAKIFSGKITKWDDPEIAKDNAGVSLPSSSIQTIHRSDGSGTTDNFTKYLTAAAKSDWTYGPGSEWRAPGGQGSKGNEGVSASVKSTSGTIGYMELSFAQNGGIKTAKVANGSGELVEVSSESVAKAVDAATVAGTGNDLELTLDYNTSAAGAYPIFLVTYEITCEKGLPADQLALVRSFFTYTASAEGQQVLADLGYAPLGQGIDAKVRDTVAALG